MTEQDINLVRRTLDSALEAGAQKARATLNVSSEDLVATLNGEVDRITHCADRSMDLALFVDGRFGSFSTNKLDEESLKGFVGKAVGIVRMMAPDACRDLPSRSRICVTAQTGDELDLVDEKYFSITSEERIRRALDASVFAQGGIISEEGEYSDSLYETVVMDTEGLCCRHRETSFDYGVEITIEENSLKYSGYWWDASSRLSEMDAASCGRKALQKARAQIGSKPARSGKYNMVVASEVASKVVSPLLRALNAYAIQQNNSFLAGSLGKTPLPEGLTIMDCPHIKGQTCSKLFDSEGTATREGAVIERGKVTKYFVNTYMSHKLGIEPTIEDATRPRVLPWPEAGLRQDDILKMCGSGILVTGFNGGNSNSATGDFSYGIEGFKFKNGRIVGPVSEMVVTGNFLTLWSRFTAAGEDARPCLSNLIPTLAFSNVDFSG